MRTGAALALALAPALAAGGPAAAPPAGGGADLVDFSSVRALLKSDNLERRAREKERTAARRKERALKERSRSFDLPGKGDFWGLLSELWLVRNADLLKWDVRRPDRGLEDSFAGLLSSLGRHGQRFRILLTDSRAVSHVSLPADPGDAILVLSVPFLEALGASLLETALLLHEDLVRSEAGFFKDFVLEGPAKTLIGGNFEGKPWPKDAVEGALAAYDRLVLARGFDFKQQFQVTKASDRALGGNAAYRRAYRGLVAKKDRLVGSDPSFRGYARLYPSPELQMNWLAGTDRERGRGP